jgi:chromosomal replication initiation ATPase DnaA
MSDDQFTFFVDEGAVALGKAWEQALERLAEEVPATAHKKFLQPLRPVRRTNDEVHFAAPGNFVAEWVKDRYIKKISSALSDELGEVVTI